jgi:hypothetical protein
VQYLGLQGAPGPPAVGRIYYANGNKMLNQILEIAKVLLSYFNNISKNEYSIFLCGGSSIAEAKFRNDLREYISSVHTRNIYNIYLPEDIFLELLMGYKKYDSLSLENILAKSVNSIVIPLQSTGTFTELGAFANKEDLKNKLIIINDPKYKKKKSFVNTGPITYLEENTTSQVLYIPYDYAHIKEIAINIRKYTRLISKTNIVDFSLKNPLSSRNFYLSMVYIFEPISKKQINEIIGAFDNSQEATIVMETALNSLVNQRKIIMDTNEKYYFVKSAIYDINNMFVTKKMNIDIIDFLTTLRFEALTITLRRKTKKIWERSSI